MTITFKIDTGNAAFGDPEQGLSRLADRDAEVARIVETFARQLRERGKDGVCGMLMDSNGNTVGSVTVRGR